MRNMGLVLTMVAVCTVACGCKYNASGVPLNCGNGVVEEGEVCDGTNLAGQTCENVGDFTGGTLGCSADCRELVLDECQTPCGNAAIDEGETCDGTNFAGATCDAIEGYQGGTLACAEDCSELVITGCIPNDCGNTVIDMGETCDGENLASHTCVTAGFVGGFLVCDETCQLDTFGCNDIEGCGNGVIDNGEECDNSSTANPADDLLGSHTCETEGYTGGTLACASDCTLDVSSCTGLCGNGTQDAGEECDDGGNNSDTTPDACREDCTNPSCGDDVTDTGETCDDGNTAPNDGCSSTCQVESSCGDGTVDTGEECDTGNLDGENCTSLGFTNGGTLTCDGTCNFDTSGCHNLEDCGTVGDEDNDGFADGQDTDCWPIADSTANTFEHCMDGLDNNGDKMVDCADPHCVGSAVCGTVSPNCDWDCTDPACSGLPCDFGETVCVCLAADPEPYVVPCATEGVQCGPGQDHVTGCNWGSGGVCRFYQPFGEQLCTCLDPSPGLP
jgi:cysteine-rich repeat protein